jgi:hypothetical protein
MPRMSETQSPHSEPIEAIEALDRKLPIWGPEIVVAVAIAIDVVLPGKLTVGPSWLLPTLEGVLLVGLVVASPHPYVRHSPARRRVAIALIALVSLTNAVSLGLLSHFLLKGGMENGRTLIFSGALLWLTNVLLFGLWYWELDSGGPNSADAKTPPASRLPVRADGGPPLGPEELASKARRLPVRLVHQRNRVQPNRHDAADRDRQVADERAGCDRARDRRAGCVACREHPRLMRVRLPRWSTRTASPTRPAHTRRRENAARSTGS